MNTTSATAGIKTFGQPSARDPGSRTLAEINSPTLQINGAELDIVRGILEADHSISSSVKDILAILMLEAAKGLGLSATELIELTGDSKISIPELGFDIINKLRPVTSQIGMKTVNANASDVTHINRNIIS